MRLRRFDNGMRVLPFRGRHVAAVEWAIAQAVPELPRGNAVAVMDAALFSGLIDRRGLDAARRIARGRRGVAARYECWGLVDSRAESPLETFGRLECVDAGVPPDELQVPLLDAAGRIIGRGDMGWRLGPGRWLIAEMDGRQWHETPDALLRDRWRQNALMPAADVLRFTAEDLRRPGRVGATVRAHLQARRGAR